MGILTVNTDPYKLWGDNWTPPHTQTPEEYRDALYSNNLYYTQYLTLDYTGVNAPMDLLFMIPAEIGTDLVTSVSYSTDDGETWTTVNNVDNVAKSVYVDGQAIDLAGGIVLFKGVAKQYSNNNKFCYFAQSFGDDGCKIYGNILSMFYGDDFLDYVSFPENSTYNCARMFTQDTNGYYLIISDVSNLILPVLTTEGCYMNMFDDQSNITKTPLLPALTLSKKCYATMFDNCELDYIQMLATDISAEDCLSSYIDDGSVAENGTFVKNKNMTVEKLRWVIPTGWTVLNHEHFILYVDKFPTKSELDEEGISPYYWEDYSCETREEYIEWEVSQAGVVDDSDMLYDVYEYNTDTLKYYNDTYYVCTQCGTDAPLILLLSTNDFDTLKGESIEESGTDSQFTSLMYVFDYDKEPYDDNTENNRQLLKIIKDDN